MSWPLPRSAAELLQLAYRYPYDAPPGGYLLRDGQLHMNRRGGYGVADRLNLVPGTVLGKEDGFGFLRPDAGGDDIFLPPAQMRRVLHGDRVMVGVTGIDRRGRREGVIVEVLDRRATRLVGVYNERGGVGLVDPDDARIHMDVLIPAPDRGEARNGQLVVCEIVEPPSGTRPPIGRILTVLGDRLTASLVVETAIHSHGIPHEWPAETLREAEATAIEVTSADHEGRVDLRELPLVTGQGHDLSAEGALKLDPSVVITDKSMGPPEVLDQLRDEFGPVFARSKLARYAHTNE